MRIALVLAFCAIPGLCQDVPVRTPGIYESFFLTVSQLSKADTEKLTAPTMQDAIGLTATEMQVLNDIGTDWAAKSLEMRQSIGRLVFEGRMRAIESGNSEWLAQNLKELDMRIGAMVARSVEKLKAGLGESAFARVENFVRSDWAHHCFVAPCFPPAAVPSRRQ